MISYCTSKGAQPPVYFLTSTCKVYNTSVVCVKLYYVSCVTPSSRKGFDYVKYKYRVPESHPGTPTPTPRTTPSYEGTELCRAIQHISNTPTPLFFKYRSIFNINNAKLSKGYNKKKTREVNPWPFPSRELL